ncbi:MAG: ATP-binding protein [Spirochaetota bacterium]
MIARAIAPVILESAEHFPVVTILGPRQSGKTTLVRALFPKHLYLNLESPETRELAMEDPRSLLRDGEEELILDEVQRVPQLLSWVQVFSDRTNRPGRFVVTGSNQPLLSEAISQSLAGRTSLHRLLPLSMEELGREGLLDSRDNLLVKGFMPRLYDASLEPRELYSAYFATYVERDVRRLINVRDLTRFETFIRLLAGRVGQLVNLSALSSDVGVSSTTLGDWLSALEASFLVFRLTPYHVNLGKRLVKTPKLYFTEPGLLAWLLQVETPGQVARDPLLGGMYENLVVVEALKAAHNRGIEPRLSFYRDKSGLEVDMLREYQRRPFPVEIKAASTFTAEMLKSLERFAALGASPPGGAVIYSGPSQQPVRGIEIRNHVEVGELLFADA